MWRLVRTVLLRQLADDRRVGGVDGLHDLVVADRAAEPEVVPAGAPDVGHDGGVVRVAQQPLVRGVPAGAALQADPQRLAGAEEGEDLRADLRHDVAFPRLILPGARLGEAVSEQVLPYHALMVRARAGRAG